MRDYKKIKAWKLADDLVVLVYGITPKFPKSVYRLLSKV